MRSLLILILLAAAGYVGYQYYQTEEGRQAMQDAVTQARSAASTAQQAATEATAQAGAAISAAGRAAQSTAAIVVGGVDVGAELKELVDRTATTLGGITDRASAEAALPTLQDLQGKVDGLTDQVDQLPAEGRRLFAGLVTAGLPALRVLADRVGTMDGAQHIKPTLDAMITRLEGWANAPA